MNVMGRFSSLFHPFGGAVDIIVVQQQNGSFKTTPWYVRFGKFQGVLKGAEKLVKIEVNGSEVNFHMNLDNAGEAYFIKETHSDKENEKNDGPDHFDSFDGLDERVTLGMDRLARTESDTALFYDFQDEDFLDSSPEPSEYGPVQFDNLGDTNHVLESQPSSEVILVSVDGHILTAPVTSEEENGEILNLNTPEDACTINSRENESAGIRRGDIFLSCLELTELAKHSENGDSSKRMENMKDSPMVICGDENVSGDGNGQLLSSSGIHSSVITPALSVADDSLAKTPLHSDHNISDNIPNQLENLDSKAEEHNKLLAEGHNAESRELLVDPKSQNIPSREDTSDLGLELSICKNLLHAGMGFGAAAEVFDANRVSEEEFRLSASSIIKNENLVVRYRGKYLPWEKAAPVVLGLAAYGCDIPIDVNDSVLVENEFLKTREVDSGMSLTPSRRRWRRLWSIPFRRVKSFEHTSSISSNDEVFVDSECFSPVKSGGESPHKQFVRTNVPTSDQIASLNLKEGQNIVTFIFSTRVLGMQKVDAHIYLWKYNARIVISDVDGTITRSDVLGQFMPLVGRDWTHSGIARLFSAIKENGYQLLFLSARAIVQAYLTRSFLFNLKQDGKTLPSGPVVISPDGLFPSLYREVIRRAPHEFKIACLEDIKALFPPDYNPFYAGFGNRHTDELSYRKVGIPKGKIFIINPKGEVAINNRVDVKSYTSLHTLVHDMFPPSLVEQEEYNSWNFWKMPLVEVDDL